MYKKIKYEKGQSELNEESEMCLKFYSVKEVTDLEIVDLTLINAEQISDIKFTEQISDDKTFQS